MTIQQQRLFDGFSVNHERGTIGSFQIEDEDIKHFKADDVLVLVVTASVAGGGFKHDASGDWVRTNKLVAHQVRVADGVMKEEIVEFYNLGGDQLFLGSAGPSRSSGGSGSTHVEPDVASAGNNAVQDDNPDDQDFSPNGADDVADDGDHGSNAARDQVLAAFLDDPDVAAS